MNLILMGIASFYSVAGCLGCSPTLTMANGERLDDTKQTIALPLKEYKMYKNKTLKITNIKNGKFTYAKVSDTGGFSRYGRIADLNLATKTAIKCSSLCNVRIER